MPAHAQIGLLPLSHAIASQAGPEVVLALLLPDVTAKDSKQSYLLLKEFAEYREQVLAALLADLSAQELRHPTSKHGDTVDGGEEVAPTFYSWSKLVSGTEDTCVNIVKAILNTRQHDAQKLADLRDDSLRKAFDM